jgi:DNA-3-methyladenine glycosylase I
VKDYYTIFNKVESALFSRSTLGAELCRASLDRFKHLEGKTFSDADYYWILVQVVFYSGFRAANVNKRLKLIGEYFSDFRIVADYGNDKVSQILSDSDMIKNERKIRACISNAQKFKEIVAKYGSIREYIASFQPAHPDRSFENLMLLKEDLDCRFDGLGDVTAYHFLTDIGMPVAKPDRVLCRIFWRLGLIESEKYTLKTVFEAKKFAEATGYPVRYIDIVFVLYGQVSSDEFGIERGVCLDEPNCGNCGVTDYCNWYAQNKIKRGG